MGQLGAVMPFSKARSVPAVGSVEIHSGRPLGASLSQGTVEAAVA